MKGRTRSSTTFTWLHIRVTLSRSSEVDIEDRRGGMDLLDALHESRQTCCIVENAVHQYYGSVGISAVAEATQEQRQEYTRMEATLERAHLRPPSDCVI